MPTVTIELDQAHIDVLKTLTPGFGNDVNEVIHFIIIDWLNNKFGYEWLQKHGLVQNGRKS